MAEQLSFHDLQLQKWAKDVHDRKESGLTVKEWCSQNNLSPNTYNYRVKALKKAAVQYVPSRVVEITPPSIPEQSASSAPACTGNVTFTIKDVTVTVAGNDLTSTLTSIIQAARNA